MGRPLIIQYSTSTAWQSAIIRKLCHSPFSHVDLVLSDGTLLGASDQGAHAKAIKGNPQGVAIREPEYQEFGIRRQMIIDTPLAEKIENRWLGQLGKPFDDSALHAFLDDRIFDRNWRDNGMWFCSELGVWAKEAEGFWGARPLQWAKSRISPMDNYLVMMQDERFVNYDTFWNPVPGLKLGPHER